MDSFLVSPLFRSFTLIVGSMAAGYLARRKGLLPESLARPLMTFVTVGGYAPVGFLSIWSIDLHGEDVLLPIFSACQIAIMALLGLAVGRLLARNRSEIGLFGISSSIGNNGATMGGFVIFLIYGETGLGISSIYCLSFTTMMVLVLFPIARRYSGHMPDASLGRLMLRSLFDWRAMGLLFSVAAIFLSASGIPRPGAVERYHVIDVLVYLVSALAYFSIGLRLRMHYVRPLLRMLLGLAGMRFVVSMIVCAALLALVRLLPWSLGGMRERIVFIQSFVPTAVTNVAVANMFDLRPREASVLFVVNTLTYLVVVLPIVFAIFG